MTFPTRHSKQYGFKKLDLMSLRKLGRKVVCSERFHRNHGNLLGIIKTNVDEGLLQTFVQFYDPDYYCFGFSDFQLVPTLEEYSYWTDLPVLERVPFNDLDKIPRYSVIAAALHLTTTEVKANLKPKGNLLCFSTDFLYQKAVFSMKSPKSMPLMLSLPYSSMVLCFSLTLITLLTLTLSTSSYQRILSLPY